MAGEDVLIDLKVLSPSTEVRGDIVFSQIPASTTVKELKLRIQNEIATRPSTDRMRLIYRGRVLAVDTDTMVNVFGLDNLKANPDQSIHLVLRELHHSATPSTSSLRSSAATPGPRSSTAPPPNPFRPPVPALQTNPFRTLYPQARLDSQPQSPQPHAHAVGHHHHHHHHVQAPNPFGGLPIPPPVNDIFQQQIAQAMAQAQAAHGPHQHAPATEPSPMGGERSQEGATASNGTDNTNAGGTHSQPPNQETTANRENNEGHPTSTTSTPPQPGLRPPNLPPQATRTIRHEAIGANGERWTLTINSGNVTIPVQQPTHTLNPLTRPFVLPPHLHHPMARPASPVTTLMDREIQRVRASLMEAQREIHNLRLLLQAPAAHDAASTLRREYGRRHMDSLMRTLDQVQAGLTNLGTIPEMSRQQSINDLMSMSTVMRADATVIARSMEELWGPESLLQPSAAPPTTSVAAGQTPQTQDLQGTGTQGTQGQQSSVGNPVTAPGSSGPDLFLLSSPEGPVGILFDERGTYRTAPLTSALPFQTFAQQFPGNPQLLANVGEQIGQNHFQFPPGANAAFPPPAQNADVDAVIGAAPVVQVANRAAQQERPGMQVLFGHAWVVIKIAFFIYFFAGGGSWYRPLMMGLLGAVFYLAQLGIFEGHVERFRRHFEAVLGLDDAGRGARGAANQQNQANPGAAAEQQAAAGVRGQLAPRPLLSQVRDRLGLVERAVALFVASLWPGLGERMVQAHEEREAARRREEEDRRQAEEQRVQEEEEARRGENSAEQPGHSNQDGEHFAVAEGSASTVLSEKGKGKQRADPVSQDDSSADNHPATATTDASGDERRSR